MPENNLHRQNIIACVWDFDKTLIPGFMQEPIFKRYGIDEQRFWDEVNSLPELYAKRGQRVSGDTIYLNHLLTYIRCGPMKGLNNHILRELGAQIVLYPGLPEFFQTLKDAVAANADYQRHSIRLEHYIISTGLAEMIRGCAIADHVDGIYGCELLETPAQPHFSLQHEMELDGDREISQIGMMVDNTIKTRFIFEINKGTNKSPDIDVNAKIAQEDRRIPINNMIYTADGPSDVPVFSIVKKNGGKAYAVYDPASEKEFKQNDKLLQVGRIHAYGPADYRPESSTHRWLKMHVADIADRICHDHANALANRVSKPPRHIREENDTPTADPTEQGTLIE